MRVGVGVELQSEQNATNEQIGWTKMKMTETLGCIKVRRTKKAMKPGGQIDVRREKKES